MKQKNFNKIGTAFVRGNILRKTKNRFFWFFETLLKKVDVALGRLYRKIWGRFQKIDGNTIVFMTYSNKYECNPKYITEELVRRNVPYDIVWIVPQKGPYNEAAYPPQVIQIRRNSMEAFYAQATAKVWVENALNFYWHPYVPKKKGQVYINTWHGSMGLKRIDKNANRKWLRQAFKSGSVTDYCVSNSTFEDEVVFRGTYWPNTPILNYGHARNDILFEKDPEKVIAIRERVLEGLKLMPKIPVGMHRLRPERQAEILAQRQEAMDCHYVLYAPTFRDSKTTDCYNIDFDRLLDSLQARFGGQWKVLMRMHYKNRAANMGTGELFVPATNYPDMQELMCAADVGITDYSSWICDFVLTGKPGFIYATDLAEYNNERGFYYPLESTPFPLATDNDQLCEAVEQFDQELYARKKEEFLEARGCVEDGHAAERIVDKIIEIMENR